jgi:hypothetical protein
MKKQLIHKINASKTRLSDEEIDPLEKDDQDSIPEQIADGWLPWDQDDMLDIRRLIYERMDIKQRDIMEAFLAGQNFIDINVTEKYWRWHFNRAIEFIRKELKL